MNVLYISYDGLTDTLGRSQVLPYLCGLSKKGAKITILSCDKPHRYIKDFKNVKEITNQFDIQWYSVMYSNRLPILSPIFNILKMYILATKLCRRKHIDIVHCRSYMASNIGLYLKRYLGIKFIFDMRGFFADERVDGGIWNREKILYNIVYKYFKKKEKSFLTEADHIVSLTEIGKKILIQQMDCQRPISVIPCCADIAHFSYLSIDEQDKINLARLCGIKMQDLVISYVGSLGSWYLLDEMVAFVSQLMKQKSNVKFLLITPDNQDFVYNITDKYNIDRKYIIIKHATREEMPLFISLSHISLFFIQPVFSKKASSPTKMGELLSMGIPLIVNSGVGDVDSIVQETQCGILVKEFTSEAFQQAIEAIDDLLKVDKQYLHSVAKKYYSLDDGIERYHHIYNNI